MSSRSTRRCRDRERTVDGVDQDVLEPESIPAPDVPGAAITRHPDTRNAGTHIIHTGGTFDSHIPLPVIPAP